MRRFRSRPKRGKRAARDRTSHRALPNVMISRLPSATFTGPSALELDIPSPPLGIQEQFTHWVAFLSGQDELQKPWPRLCPAPPGPGTSINRGIHH